MMSSTLIYTYKSSLFIRINRRISGGRLESRRAFFRISGEKGLVGLPRTRKKSFEEEKNLGDEDEEEAKEERMKWVKWVILMKRMKRVEWMEIQLYTRYEPVVFWRG